MNYKKILQQAFGLTTGDRNLWMFGLILYGGFNLFLINLFAFNANHQVRNLFLPTNRPPEDYAVFLFSVLVILGVGFVVMNYVKVRFIVSVHNSLHRTPIDCALCQKTENEQIPYQKYFNRLILTSATTIALTLLITLLARVVLIGLIDDSLFPVLINVIFVLGVTTLLGVWNLFTSFFVVIHNLDFSRASKAGIDLLALQLRRIIEFVFILCLIYFITTIVGNAFINIWNHAFILSSFPMVRVAALVAFIVWFAFNNVFFNVSMVIFFMELVKSVKAPESGQVPVNVVN